MSELIAKKLAAKPLTQLDKAEKANPASAAAYSVNEETRVPMSTPELKLATPDLPGHHQHWFLSGNVERALRAGYVFVDEDEIGIVGRGFANDLSESGNSDLGTRVSIEAGRGVEWRGQPERLYLMKIRQEWWEADQKKLEDKNDQIASALRGSNVQNLPGNESVEGLDHSHIPTWAPQRQKTVNNLFTRKRR